MTQREYAIHNRDLVEDGLALLRPWDEALEIALVYRVLTVGTVDIAFDE